MSMDMTLASTLHKCVADHDHRIPPPVLCSFYTMLISFRETVNAACFSS